MRWRAQGVTHGKGQNWDWHPSWWLLSPRPSPQHLQRRRRAGEPRSQSAEDTRVIPKLWLTITASIYELGSNTTNIYWASISCHVLRWALPALVHLNLTREMWSFPAPHLSEREAKSERACDHPRPHSREQSRFETSFPKSRLCPSSEVLYMSILPGKAPQVSSDFQSVWWPQKPL